MKKIFLFFAMLLVLSVSQAQTSSENYVLTKRVVDNGDTLVDVQYFDGLGRNCETVKKYYSDNGAKDLIALNQYDGMGNLYKSWNPVPYPGTSERISDDVIGITATNVYGDSVPYTLYEYDKTLNCRLCKECGPGFLWAKNGKAKEVSRCGNEANVYPVFKLSGNKKSFSFDKYYAPGTLLEIKWVDEDGLSITKCYDIFNNLVLEKNGVGKITYYIYDNDGKLVFVLPPAVYEACSIVKNINHSISEDEDLQKFAYFYRYDEKGRCVEKKLPGCEPILMIYDKDDKLIFKQDGNQRKNKEWLFMLFDSHYRPTVTGICRNADKLNVENLNVTSSYSTTGKYAMYNTNVDLDTIGLMKVNYYDGYTFLKGNSSYTYQKYEDYDKDVTSDGNQFSAAGLLTGDRTYELGDSHKYYLESLYYNSKGQIVQSHRGNSVNGVDVNFYKINPFTGKLYKEKLVHHVGMRVNPIFSDSLETITKRYAYDNKGRLDSMTYKLSNYHEILLRHNVYDDFGRVGCSVSHSPQLSTSYEYNVRGQLTSACNMLTTQHLYYNTHYGVGQVSPCYNGNLCAYEWSGNMDGIYWNTESYEYEYNKNNWLVDAYSSAIGMDGHKSNGVHDAHFEYDEMGHIIGVIRKSENIDDGSVGERDNAVLEYEGNHLKSVVNGGFVDSSRDPQIANSRYDSVESYAYDANGNMTRNLNKDILKITYNVLNLPEYVYLRNNELIHNIYDADGNKLRSCSASCKYNITLPESGNFSGNLDDLYVLGGTDVPNLYSPVFYSGDFIYDVFLCEGSGPSLSKLDYSKCFLDKQRVNFGEGYYLPGEIFPLHDYVKDYLGNVRYDITNVQILQGNNYCPYGGFYGDDKNESQQRWRFGNKELDRKVDIYSWGFRNYDPTVGSFLTVDPMCELNYKMSPYSFADNNPVNYTDLFGLETYSWYDFVKHWHDFDVNNDDVELPQVVCTASKPFTFENAYDEFGRRLDEIEGYSRLLYKVNYNFGGSKLSQPLWNAASYIKNNYSSLGNKLNLSTFHPSYVYRGITNNINKIVKYGKMAGNVSMAMDFGKIIATGGDVQSSDVFDIGISSIAIFCPGYGWAIIGGYLLLDTGVEMWTGKSIGEHLNDYTREHLGYDTFNVVTQSFK